MIKANELGIGNWVNICGNPEQITVGLFYYLLNQNHSTGRFEDLEPIPITPEILEKAGFIKTAPNGEYINKKVGVFTIAINEIGLVSFQIGDVIFSSMHYLHQLQNLYFDLTGEELKIDL